MASILRSAFPCVALLTSLGLAHSLTAADPENPDWPCVQRKVPMVSAAMVWAGPEIAEDDRRWRESRDIAELVDAISARRVPLEEAYASIDGFAAGLDDRNGKLTLLFIGLLQTINAERSEIIIGIERYARRQKELANRIRTARAELGVLQRRRDLTETERARANELEQQLRWDTRVFDEREESLAYVCESPVLLEQRLFALARHINAYLE